MTWLPWMQQPYYNPTTNRVPLSVLENWQAAALQNADEKNDFEGIDTDRSDDIPSPWVGIKPKPVTVPIQPVQQMTLAERRQKLKEMREERRTERRAKRRRRLEG